MIGAVPFATSNAGADGPERRRTACAAPAVTAPSRARTRASQPTGTDEAEVDRTRRVAISRVRPGRSTNPWLTVATCRTGGAVSHTSAYLRAATRDSDARARAARCTVATAACRGREVTGGRPSAADGPFEPGAARATERAAVRIETVCNVLGSAAKCGRALLRTSVTPGPAAAGPDSGATLACGAGCAGSGGGSGAGVVSTGADATESGLVAVCAGTGADEVGVGAACGSGAGLAGAAGCWPAGLSGRGGRNDSGSR
jgi:hypothetical protein